MYQVYSLYRVLEALLIEMAVVGTSLFRLVEGELGHLLSFPPAKVKYSSWGTA